MTHSLDTTSAPPTVATPPSSTTYARGLSATRFLAGSFATDLIGAALLAAVLALFNDPTWWRGFEAAGVAGFVALVASSVPMTLLFGRPLAVIMNGYLLAGGIRAVALGAVVVLAIRAGGYPQNPTVACSAVLYCFIVVGEGLLLWSMISSSPLDVVPDVSADARSNRDPQ